MRLASQTVTALIDVNTGLKGEFGQNRNEHDDSTSHLVLPPLHYYPLEAYLHSYA